MQAHATESRQAGDGATPRPETGGALTRFPALGIDVLEVTDGQDRGARFSLHGSEAILGRAPVVDVMLTDPAVAPRHARLSISGGRLRVEDLGSGTATRVNGAPLAGPTAVARGDRIGLGTTELTVRWTPERPAATRAGWPAAPAAAPPSPSPPPPPPPAPPPVPPPAPASAPPSPEPLRSPDPPPPIPGGAGPPGAALALALLAAASLAVPVLDDASGARSVWSVGSAGLRVVVLVAVAVAATAAASWLAGALGHSAPLAAGLAPASAAAAGGVLAGVALFLATADVGGDRRAGVLLLLAVAAGLVACAGAGVLRAAPPGPSPVPAGAPPEAVVAAAGALIGGTMAAIATALTWVERGVFTLGGFDAGVLTARGLLPLALATVGAGIMAPVAAVRLGRRDGALAAILASALGAAALGFGVTAAAVYRPLVLGPGAGLAVAGGAIALVTGVAGALGLMRREPKK